MSILLRYCISASIWTLLSNASSSCPSECKLCSNSPLFGPVVNCPSVSSIPKGIPNDTHRLYMHNSKLYSLPWDTFQHLSNLRVIQLQNCSISFIHDDCFLGLDKLTSLWLYDNQLRAIPRLSTLSNLVYLNIASNLLSSIDNETFQGLVNLKTLYLDDNKLEYISKTAFSRLPELEALYLRNLHLSTISIIGLKQLATLHLSGNGPMEISEGSFNILPNLEELNLKDSEIILVGSPFSNLPNLTKLDLTGSKLSFLHERSFQGLRNLRTLSVSGCNLTSVSLKFLVSLERLFLGRNYFLSIPRVYGLKNLYMQSNKLEVIHEADFNRCPSLTLLYLQDNEIATVHPKAFRSLRNLKQLRLENNRLTYLPDNLYLGLTSLQLIFLNGNGLAFINERTFRGLISLKRLYLRDNRLKTIKEYSFSDLSNLDVLDLNNNELEHLTQACYVGLSNLRSLVMSSNKLTSLPNNVFKSLKKLILLKIDKNELNSLTQDTFGPLENLRHLDLSHNNITTIKNGTFIGLPKVVKLDLRDNSLTSITPGLFSGLVSLTYLFISGNPFPCTCSFKKMIQSLNAIVEADCVTEEGDVKDILDISCKRGAEGEENNLTPGYMGRSNYLMTLPPLRAEGTKMNENSRSIVDEAGPMLIDNFEERSKESTSMTNNLTVLLFVIPEVVIALCFGIYLSHRNANDKAAEAEGSPSPHTPNATFQTKLARLSSFSGSSSEAKISNQCSDKTRRQSF